MYFEATLHIAMCTYFMRSAPSLFIFCNKKYKKNQQSFSVFYEISPFRLNNLVFILLYITEISVFSWKIKIFLKCLFMKIPK